MRTPKRIQNFLDKINWFELIHHQWNIYNSKLDAYATVSIIETAKKEIEIYWRQNPDFRISQVLIGLGILPNKSGFWFYDESYDILIEQGIPPEECLYWISIMDKDENPLDKPFHHLIKDMTKNHIQKIINGNYRITKQQEQAFNNILNK
jgi:hypothetical protein